MKIVDGWVDDAVEIDYQSKSMSREGYKPTHVVLHGTAGGSKAENTANYFKTSTVDASAHLIIGQDGTIVQGISMDDAAWGNGILLNPRLPFPANVNPNYYTISIEHCKPSTDNSDQLTEAQKQSSFKLVKTICEYYNIPKRRGDAISGIVEHADFDSINRARCPGPYPYSELMKFLAEGTAGVPHGWTDVHNVLTAPNGIVVVRGFRDWILNHPWDPNNYPLEAEHSANPVEESNPSLGQGTTQTFRLTRLAWTPALGSYVTWLGQEYLHLFNNRTPAIPTQVKTDVQVVRNAANKLARDVGI
ncbi:MAG: N-acetylmuramoyl-L-alanine amidase [Chloroflexi bacterium]|nr:MAG: N-acetylmuramoyl-L-alanine amidase [Chloroflexota bacterium]